MVTWDEALRRAEMVAVGAALGRQGLVRGREGNISCRLDESSFLLTPAGSDKRLLAAPVLMRCSIGAELPRGASSEGLMHRETYRSCPGVRALVHAHPPAVLALAARGQLPDPAWLKEGEAVVGSVARVPVLSPGSMALARACAEALRASAVAVMTGHGVVAAGRDLYEALARVEVTELLARLALASHRHAEDP